MEKVFQWILLNIFLLERGFLSNQYKNSYKFIFLCSHQVGLLPWALGRPSSLCGLYVNENSGIHIIVKNVNLFRPSQSDTGKNKEEKECAVDWKRGK